MDFLIKFFACESFFEISMSFRIESLSKKSLLIFSKDIFFFINAWFSFFFKTSIPLTTFFKFELFNKTVWLLLLLLLDKLIGINSELTVVLLFNVKSL